MVAEKAGAVHSWGSTIWVQAWHLQAQLQTVRCSREKRARAVGETKEAFVAVGCEEAKVAHFDEAFRQYVLQEAMDEFFSGEGA